MCELVSEMSTRSANFHSTFFFFFRTQKIIDKYTRRGDVRAAPTDIFVQNVGKFFVQNAQRTPVRFSPLKC